MAGGTIDSARRWLRSNTGVYGGRCGATLKLTLNSPISSLLTDIHYWYAHYAAVTRIAQFIPSFVIDVWSSFDDDLPTSHVYRIGPLGTSYLAALCGVCKLCKCSLFLVHLVFTACRCSSTLAPSVRAPRSASGRGWATCGIHCTAESPPLRSGGASGQMSEDLLLASWVSSAPMSP